MGERILIQNIPANLTQDVVLKFIKGLVNCINKDLIFIISTQK